MRRIEVTVSPTGETTIKTSGFTGKACQDATRELERALGMVTGDTPTAEMRLAAPARDQVRQKN